MSNDLRPAGRTGTAEQATEETAMAASEYAGEADTREFVGGFSGLAPEAADPQGPDEAAAAAASVDLLAPPEGARDVEEELAAPPRAKLPRVTLLLAAGVLLAGGFFAGVKVDRWQNGTGEDAARGTAPAAGRQNTAAQGQGAAGTAGQPGGRTGTGGAGTTTGTVKLVDGSTVYVTDASGTIVKVTTNADTKIQVSQDGKPADLKPGDTVVVRGAAGDDGTVAASTVTQGQAGAGLASGGFGGAGTAAGTGAGTGAGGTRAGTGSGRG
ncbi:hypothetical protein GCM10023205_10400 [Yinghuangia aomiensis]|uniref:DUF5666 domain-containing protein n=1 Tax=Yinghuangia aomiensis TaxID=676205 RepID=A0ABP9GS17_9ACTN